MTISRPGAVRALRLAVAALACLGVAACGGDGGKDRTPIPMNIVVGPDGDFTGHVLELTIGVTYIATTNVQMAAGDDAANNLQKGFIRFDLSGVPAGATVQDATMSITQVAPTGSPYADLLTNLQVEIELEL